MENLVWDPVAGVNLILCMLILLFGLAGYRRSHSSVPLIVGLAFGLFGLSHLATLFGLMDTMETVFIAVRTTAYLMVAFVLYLLAFGGR